MGKDSKIEWTDHTANFWWGCVKVSPGCQHCYAETLANRFGDNIWGPPKTTNRELKKGIWKDLPRWNRQARESDKRMKVFVMSMGDFFEDHQQVTEWRFNAMQLMEYATRLDFQVLTKRPENILSMVPASWLDNWPEHIWIGTSVENQEQADKRIPELSKVPAAVRFLSCEPLLGPVDLSPYLQMISLVIVGGESGPNARPFHLKWAYDLIEQCQDANAPIFIKQLGSNPKCIQWGYSITGKGGNWHEWPADLRIREFPNEDKL